MKAFIQKLLSVSLCAGLLLGGMKPCSASSRTLENEQPAGYLAVYVASHEHNMGVEYAQFPSGTYTDTCRTDVLYYGLSKDGKHFEGLNNDKPVYYPKGFHSLGSPSLFRKSDGSYGLIASLNNASDEIFISDSQDLIFFGNERVRTLNTKGITVKNPTAECQADGSYNIYWEGGDGHCYMTETDDFTSFSDPQSTDYKKESITGSLPSYAQTEEAAVFELTEQEYDRIEKKYGKIESVAVHGIDDLYIMPGTSASLPKQVTVEYHNPNNNLWSLTERAGYLRLKSGLLSQNIRTARNTLTQRTCGPTSGASTAIEVGHMRDGDVAGIAAFQNQYGFVGVKMENGTKYLVMHRASRAGDADGQEQERVPLTGDRVYLKVNCDFRENTSLNQTWRMKDEAYFYYSPDGENWTQIGDTLNMSYDWPDFMGYRFGLFYYSTQNRGGYVDFDYFHISPVDGQKQKLQAQIREAESIQRQPHHTEQQWHEFTECLAQAKTVVQELPDDESELSLPEIEQSNRPAYTVMEQLQKQTAELKSEQPSETEQPDAPSATATTAPGQPAAPESSSAPSPATGSGSSAALSNSPSPDAPGTVKSKKITVKAAGYPFAKQGIRLAKGMKTRLKATVFPAQTTAKKVTYTSGNKKAVSVSPQGIVTAVKPGSAKITVTAGDGGAKAALKIKVVGTKTVNRLLKAAKKSIVIKKGSYAEFVLKKKSAKSTSPVIYKSSNRQIATVDPYGSIFGKKKGKTEIRAICGTKSVSLKVEVK